LIAFCSRAGRCGRRGRGRWQALVGSFDDVLADDYVDNPALSTLSPEDVPEPGRWCRRRPVGSVNVAMRSVIKRFLGPLLGR
jgi:hypothetical protein